MNRDDIIAKLKSLYRLAEDQQGRPEGQTAAIMAENIVRKYEIKPHELYESAPEPARKAPAHEAPPFWQQDPPKTQWTSDTQAEYDESEFYDFLSQIENELKKNGSLSSVAEIAATVVFGSLETTMDNFFANILGTDRDAPKKEA